MGVRVEEDGGIFEGAAQIVSPIRFLVLETPQETTVYETGQIQKY